MDREHPEKPVTFDPDRVRAIVAAIPSGSWRSYGDVARAAGGTDQHARALNQRFVREETPGAHRVLKSDGTVGGTALGDPRQPRSPDPAEGGPRGRVTGPVRATREAPQPAA
jgi:alkylated DNA nucleotide flippase Atl1